MPCASVRLASHSLNRYGPIMRCTSEGSHVDTLDPNGVSVGSLVFVA